MTHSQSYYKWKSHIIQQIKWIFDQYYSYKKCIHRKIYNIYPKTMLNMHHKSRDTLFSHGHAMGAGNGHKL